MAQSFKTAISFGLVYVPVSLHACVKNNDISFNTLYKKTGQRIKYNKTCDNCPSKLSQDDLVKGYQYQKDRYVIISDEELEKIKTNKDKSIIIKQFVKLDRIDPIYFNSAYFVQPAGAENAFNLILKAIEDENKVGIAKAVLGTKEQIIAIRAINKKMVLYTMHFYDQIQSNPSKHTEEKVNPEELKLAKSIINAMSGEFDIRKYKNEYREKVLEAIDAKLRGQKIKPAEHVKTAQIMNLMDALKKSAESFKSGKKNNKQRSKKSG